MRKEYTSRMFSHHLRLFLISLLLIAAAPRPVRAGSDNWIELRSPNFIVTSNANEKQVRHVAYQFEMIRAVFRTYFNLQNSAQEPPVIIIAARDENTLKALLPEYWAKKGSAHIAGVYLGGPEKNYVGLRLDVSMNQEAYEPFEPVYHEYVHYLTRRMIAQLPLWMVEGLAEFYGNTRIEGKRALVGAPSSSNIMVLQQNPPLPLATLYRVDASSPYYHENNKTSIFYAESWALTHYLITRDWRERTQRVNDFIALLGKNVAPDEAARRTIGAPDVLEDALGQYIGHFSFMAERLDVPATIDEKNFQPQAITEAESLTMRADFMAHDRHYFEARGMLEQALKLDPALASAHESMGFLCAEQNQHEEANKWYSQAVALNSQSFLAHFYYAGNLLKGNLDADSASKAEASLRAAIKINPAFAPAYNALSWLLVSRPENAEKPERLQEAYMMGLTAVGLEPGNVHYRLNSAQVLERMGRVDDAIRVADRAASMAKTPGEQSAAMAVISNAQRHRDYLDQMKEHQEAAGRVRATTARTNPDPGSPPMLRHRDDSTSASVDLPPGGIVVRPKPPERPPLLPVSRVAEGTIKDIRCSGGITLEITFSSSAGEMHLYSDSYFKIPYSAANYTPEGTLNPCVDLKGWHARITYHPAKDQQNQGEIVAVELVKK
jgi:tetratricopeptide (TPR) repeat protein